MSYEVINDDFFEEKKPKNKKHKNKDLKIITVFKSISILILISVFVIFLFIYLNSQPSDNSKIYLVSNIDEFFQNYNGDLNMEVNGFRIEFDGKTFNSDSKTLSLQNFSGSILLNQNTFTISGKTNNINFADNSFKTSKDETFILDIEKPISFDFRGEDLNLNLKSGKIAIENKLEYEYDNINVTLKSYIGSFEIGENLELRGDSNSLDIKSKLTNGKEMILLYE